MQSRRYVSSSKWVCEVCLQVILGRALIHVQRDDDGLSAYTSHKACHVPDCWTFRVAVGSVRSLEDWVGWVLETHQEAELEQEEMIRLLEYWWYNRNEPVPVVRRMNHARSEG